jgi:NRPS condensation-like uncharacterized protein
MGSIAPERLSATAGDCATYYMMVEPGAMSPQMGAEVSFDARIDEARMAQALRLLLESEPVLGYRFVADASVPVWQRAEVAEGDALLPVRETADADSDAAAFVASAFDPCAGPQVRGVLLRSADRDTLVLQVSHVAVDGRGVIETLYRLAEIHRSLAADPAWKPPFNIEADRSFTPAAAGVGFLEKMSSMKSLTSLTEPSEWPRIEDSGKRGGEPYVFGVVEPPVFRAVKHKGRARGATINDVVLNAYHRSWCRALNPAPGTRTPIMMTSDLREHLAPDSKRGLSGFAAFWGVTLSPAGDDDFDTTLARVVERTSAWKSSGIARQKAIGSAGGDAMARGWRARTLRPMYAKLGDMLKKGMESGAPMPMFTNIGAIDEENLDFGDDSRVQGCRWFPPMGPSAGCLGAASFRERLETCMGADPKTADPDLVHAIMDGMLKELRGWAAPMERGSHDAGTC